MTDTAPGSALPAAPAYTTPVRRRRWSLALVALAPWCAVACLAVAQGFLPTVHRPRATDAGVAPIVIIDGSFDPSALDSSLLTPPPHSVSSVNPSHGPFDGGQQAIVHGTGFTSAVRVWFGPNEVAHAAVVPIDPTRVQVTVPAGASGSSDVSAQNGDDASTRTTLADGYFYDSFYVTPSSGPDAGGTVITLFGNDTSWDATTRVLVDGIPCPVTAVRNPANQPQQLDCTTPADAPGAKGVRVVTEGGSSEVLDAFTYGDSNNGFHGGLSGQNLPGQLRVIALNNLTGTAIPGATVIIGSDVTADSVKTADSNGVVVANSTATTETVTVSAHCFMPTTFVNVPVDTVTAYLDPILSPDCGSNGHPTLIGPGGGSNTTGARIQGELIWPSTIEFRRGAWDVPTPEGFPDADPNLEVVAYVFQLADAATTPFRLPAIGHATTPSDVGHVGYTFNVTTSVGNLTLYALAGVENVGVTPPLFTAYSLGVLGGVAAVPGVTTTDVYIPMNIPLDHALTLNVSGPTPTSRGPDRVSTTVGVRLGTLGYVTLPVGTNSALLPVSSPLSVVGLPPLINGLAGAEYVTTATASTGATNSVPMSVLGLTGTGAAGTVVNLDGFVEVPHLDVPAENGAWDGRTLSASSLPGGPTPDLSLFQIESGGGLSTWTVAAPKGVTSVILPDLSAVPSLEGPTGPVSITVTFAEIDGFDYGTLAYSELAARGWDAYATDTFQAHR